ncbi:alpha/beta hydrolase [Chitinimonas sp. BJB300]|uniref:alpha/beta hydrolase n=1 Tax=Chitinimonas sp. BJB300 TaxID=1559339 RepID=UPI000C11731D|nr:alpha/beta hydrolase [Chitinimonas sp. BJB300]PHV09919.1 alpha/beta hydrolase [Chitinimonas sp. BJB300]TSJ87352.1 alpha/beta hydrolase [Chitinimonas sp. BJB300]
MTVLAAGSPGMERTTQKFLDGLEAGGGKLLETLSLVEARAVLAGAQANVKLTLPRATVSQKIIEQDGQKVDLTIVRPDGAKGLTPVFVFVHGGGWILGDFPTHERHVRVNQIYAATRWVSMHGKEIKVDGSRLAVAGNSVGGDMAAAVSLMAKDKGGPKIKLQLLLWPVTDANFDNASYNQFAEGHFLTKPMMKWFWDAYTTNPDERRQIYASPLQATTAQLQGLPLALIQTAEFDVLRDEGEIYGRKLDAAGVDVTVTRYNGMIHDFGLLNVVSQTPATRSPLRQASTELKKHLQ